MSDLSESYPLREQKKKRTHVQLMQAAENIFLERGFNSTTMEEVAAAAGLHVQTLYRHFPSKIELAVAISQASFESFEQAFLARETSTVAFWRHWVSSRMLSATASGTEPFRTSLRERFSRQEIVAEFFEIDSQYETVLASGLAMDLGVSVKGDKRPMLIACLLWSSHKQMLREWAQSNSRKDPVKEAMCVVDAAIALLNVDQGLE